MTFTDTYKFNDLDPLVRDKAYNDLAKDLFKINLDNPEFLFVMYSSLLSLLLEKNIITEQEFAESTEKTGQSFKLMKYRKNLQEQSENAPDTKPTS